MAEAEALGVEARRTGAEATDFRASDLVADDFERRVDRPSIDLFFSIIYNYNIWRLS